MIIRKRRILPSLTPMIDVVFLLLLFFLLSTQLQRQNFVEIETARAGGSETASLSEIVLVEFGQSPSLNGDYLEAGALIENLAAFRDKSKAIAIRPDNSVNTQDLLEFNAILVEQGWQNVTFVEGGS